MKKLLTLVLALAVAASTVLAVPANCHAEETGETEVSAGPYEDETGEVLSTDDAVNAETTSDDGEVITEGDTADDGITDGGISGEETQGPDEETVADDPEGSGDTDILTDTETGTEDETSSEDAEETAGDNCEGDLPAFETELPSGEDADEALSEEDDEEIIIAEDEEAEPEDTVEEEELDAAATGLDAFITRAYELVLGRAPDSEGFNYWKEKLRSGKVTAASMMYGFFFSQEYLSKNTTNKQYVTTLYKAMFDRDPDTQGYNNWINTLGEGFSRLYVLNGFVGSREFKELCADFGITKGNLSAQIQKKNNVIDMFPKITRFVNGLYTHLMGRSADTTGRLDRVAILAEGETVLYVVDYMVNSAEFKRKGYTDAQIVTALYKCLLSRNPSTKEVNTWVSRMEKNGLQYVVGGFINSSEFQEKAAAMGMVAGHYVYTDYDELYPKYSEYVRTIFKKLVGRESMKSERAIMINTMANGLDAASIVHQIVNSAAFKARNLSDAEFVAVLYQALLDRTGSASEREAKVKKLTAGKSRNYILYSFLKSSEFDTKTRNKGIDNVLSVTSNYGNIPDDAFAIYNYLYSLVGNVYGVAGIMGNMMQESRLEPAIMEVKYQRLYGITSAEYTKKVDNGTYEFTTTDKDGNEVTYKGKNAFVYDAAGYGLCQWTFYTRKASFYDDAKADGRSVGNMYFQLDHLQKDLNGSWSSLLTDLKKAKSVDEATGLFYGVYEYGRGAYMDPPSSRLNFAKTFYSTFARYYKE